MTLDHDAILKLLESQDRESRAIREEALRMTWYMRGGITYDEIMQIGSQEREIIAAIIKDNMEATKKSGLPFF